MDLAGLQQLYTHVICIDFEFYQPEGERPLPLCMATYEVFSGETTMTWLLDGAPQAPAWPCTAHTLMVGYYASAELSCYLALGWAFPPRLVDAFAEFRCLSSGLTVPAGHGLLGALDAFGLPSMATAEKIRMHDLARRGPPFTAQERETLLVYCRTDVEALGRLFRAMLPYMDVRHALLRGRYLSAVVHLEWAGIPCDVETLEALRTHWDSVRGKLVQAVDEQYHVFVPQHLTLDPATPLGR